MYTVIGHVIHPGWMGRNRSLILLHVLLAAGRGRHLSVRDLGRLTGIRTPNGVRCHLLALRREGLVTWEERPNNHQLGSTLRPTCRLELAH